MFKDHALAPKLIVLTLLLLFAIISVTVISPYVSIPANRQVSLQTLDKQKMRATSLTAAVTGASFAVSALPDDTASGIADELADLSGVLMIIVCGIYLEKFLLTTTGFVSFSVLIPAACLLLGINLFRPSDLLHSWGIKLIALALLFFAIVPSGVALSNLVQDTFADSIDQAFIAAESFSNEVDQTEDESNLFAKVVEGISNGVAKLLDTAKNVLSIFTDAIAVLLITSCAIPLITLLAFVWVIRILFGIHLKLPDPRLFSRRRSRSRHQNALPNHD